MYCRSIKWENVVHYPLRKFQWTLISFLCLRSTAVSPAGSVSSNRGGFSMHQRRKSLSGNVGTTFLFISQCRKTIVLASSVDLEPNQRKERKSPSAAYAHNNMLSVFWRGIQGYAWFASWKVFKGPSQLSAPRTYTVHKNESEPYWPHHQIVPQVWWPYRRLRKEIRFVLANALHSLVARMQFLCQTVQAASLLHKVEAWSSWSWFEKLPGWGALWLNHAHDAHHVNRWQWHDNSKALWSSSSNRRSGISFLLVKGVARPSIKVSRSRLNQHSHGSSTASAGSNWVERNKLIMC